MVSRQFSGLLLANLETTKALHYQVQLTFVPAAIAAFLTQLSSQLQHDSRLVDRLHQASQQLRVNDPVLQSEFTLRLAELLTTQPSHVFPTAAVTAALQQQQIIEQHVIERTQELHDSLLVAQTANRTKACKSFRNGHAVKALS